MKAGEHLSIGLKQAIICFIIVAILSVIQQIIKDTYNKNHDSRKNIKYILNYLPKDRW